MVTVATHRSRLRRGPGVLGRPGRFRRAAAGGLRGFTIVFSLYNVDVPTHGSERPAPPIYAAPPALDGDQLDVQLAGYRAERP